jgi:hypothetical protein
VNAISVFALLFSWVDMDVVQVLGKKVGKKVNRSLRI